MYRSHRLLNTSLELSIDYADKCYQKIVPAVKLPSCGAKVKNVWNIFVGRMSQVHKPICNMSASEKGYRPSASLILAGKDEVRSQAQFDYKVNQIKLKAISSNE